MTEFEAIGPRLPAVARDAIGAWLRGESRRFAHPAPPAPVFVTLRNPDGSLRGCIGTLAPTEPDVASETARSAVLAASSDPRFTPVGPAEFAALSIEVSVLEPEEAVAGLSDLDPRVYGVIVRDPVGRRGLLLPDIPGIDQAAHQVEIACRKAGIHDRNAVRLSRFRVSKWTEGE